LSLLILKNGETVVAEIKGAEVQGWWIQDE
jgi:hypothetical protein